VLTAPFVPMLFQGEEWAASTPFQYFTDHTDPELGAAVSEGRRHEFAAFGWAPDQVPDPQALETFERSRLDWSELATEPHRSVLDWYRALLRLRQEHAELTDGRLDLVRTECDEATGRFAMRRGAVTVACNLGGDSQVFDVEPGTSMLLASEPVSVNEGKVQLPPDSVVIVGR
jgi:maltooligosyltrehalose trehalohydrolase